MELYPPESWELKLTYPLPVGSFEPMIFPTSQGGIWTRSLAGNPTYNCSFLPASLLPFAVIKVPIYTLSHHATIAECRGVDADTKFWRLKLLSNIHPGRLTWNLLINHLERKMIFQTSLIMFHVNLPGCIQFNLSKITLVKSMPIFNVHFLYRTWGHLQKHADISC